MNKTDTQKVLDALDINRVIAKDSDGNYTREVTPKLITAAIAICEASLALVEEPVAWIEWDLQTDEGDPDSIEAGCDKPDLACDGWEWRPLYGAPQEPVSPDPRLAMYQATLGVAKNAMEAFTDPEGRMPANTGEFNGLKTALFAVRMALPLCEEFEPTRPQLLLAAPDLLKACERAEEWLEGWASAESCLSDIRAAIAKAGATS